MMRSSSAPMSPRIPPCNPDGFGGSREESGDGRFGGGADAATTSSSGFGGSFSFGVSGLSVFISVFEEFSEGGSGTGGETGGRSAGRSGVCEPPWKALPR